MLLLAHLLLLLTFPYLASASCAHGTSLLPFSKRSTDASHPSFGYEGSQGPLNWANLAPENTACATGKHQSPINLDSGVERLDAGAIKLCIPPAASAPFENLGTTVEVMVNGTLSSGEQVYAMTQLHLHTP